MTVVSDYTALLTGQTWAGTGFTASPAFVTFSFDTVAADYVDDGSYTQAFIDSFTAFGAAAKTVARAALAAWADISGITLFEVAAGQGDLRFGGYDFTLDPDTAAFAGFAYHPATDVEQYFAFRDALGGDVFIDLNYVTDTFILLHEVGHAMGFKHPFEGDPTLLPALDNHDNTVMSYTGNNNPFLGPFDVQAVQSVYCLNAADGTQVASWSWNAGTETLTQSGDAAANRIFGVSVRDVINGSGGNDFIGGFGGDDVLNGGSGDDSLHGGDGADMLVGGLGNDRFTGGLGADTLNGGSGLNDLIDYFESAEGIVVGTNNGAVNTGGDAAGDILLGIEDIYGSDFADTITGNSAQNFLLGADGDDALNSSSNNDVLFGGNGDDVLLGGAGADYIDGEGNTLVGDTVSFSNAGARITLTLVNGGGTATGSGQGGGDTIVNVENITGSAFNDILTGDANANTILGGAGNDTLNGGDGDDTINGQGGLDTINGGGGDDVLIGGPDADKFVYNIAALWDDDQILGWQNNVDKIDLVGAGFDFADFTETQSGADTLLTLTINPAHSIRLVGINANTIDATDFV